MCINFENIIQSYSKRTKLKWFKTNNIFRFSKLFKKKKKIKSVGFASNEIIRKLKVFLLTYQFKGKIRNITYNKKCFSYTVIGLCYHGEVWVFGTS